VEDLDRQVLALLAEDRLHLLLDDLAGPVVGVDHVVVDLVDDVLGLSRDLEILDELVLPVCIGDGASLLGFWTPQLAPTSDVPRGGGNAPRHVCR
jgi:hypothetical protein